MSTIIDSIASGRFDLLFVNAFWDLWPKWKVVNFGFVDDEGGAGSSVVSICSLEGDFLRFATLSKRKSCGNL